MRSSMVFKPARVLWRPRPLAATLAAAAAAMLVGSSAAEPAPAARPCASVGVGKKALGDKVPTGAPVVSVFPPFSKTCTYPGGGLGSTKITFQEDTAARFASSEKSAGSFGGKVVELKGLGKAAWTSDVGEPYVFDGQETIKILALALEIRSPATTLAILAMLETLAKELL
jgi:hypothetical protein